MSEYTVLIRPMGDGVVKMLLGDCLPDPASKNLPQP